MVKERNIIGYNIRKLQEWITGVIQHNNWIGIAINRKDLAVKSTQQQASMFLALDHFIESSRSVLEGKPNRGVLSRYGRTFAPY